jgi:hypothetical protein
MAVTDLTDSLPYWARQGVGYPGGPGPTGGPGSAPMGAGNSASWLQYLQQMFNPISSANAAELGAGGAPLSGGNDGNNPYQAAAGANPAQGGPYVGSGQPPIAAANVAQPQPAPQPAPSGGGGYGAMGPQGWGVTAPNAGYNSGVRRTDAAYGPYDAPVNPNAPAPNAQTVSAQAPAPAPTPGPLATGGATAAGASANPRFIGIDRPNANPGIGGGMLGGARGGPQGTALNLAGLFNGGGPSSRVMSPANTVAGPMASKGRAYPGDDWDIDANGNVVPNYGSLSSAPGNQQMSPDALASAVKKPNWWQSLGRPDMSPDQLASAVRKPNWYRNV